MMKWKLTPTTSIARPLKGSLLVFQTLALPAVALVFLSSEIIFVYLLTDENRKFKFRVIGVISLNEGEMETYVSLCC